MRIGLLLGISTEYLLRLEKVGQILRLELENNVEAGMSKKSLPNQDRLLECFDYFQESGDIFWKERPKHHFKSDWSTRSWNTRFSGKVAGRRMKTPSGKSYLEISVDGVRYFAHRLIWMLVNGVEPEEIDHLDGNGLNNRIDNLRDVLRTENGKNLKLKSNNASGVCGVSWRKRDDVWVSRIKVDGISIHLGSFRCKDDAILHRKEAEVKYGFHENHGLARKL
jgi:hypothetical protein